AKHIEYMVGDEAIHKELGDRMEKATTTASSLEVEQDNGSGPRCQETILGGVDAQTRFETTSKYSNDPPLSRVHTLKPEGSAGFHQIVDFLNSTHIKYALTENPTIYVSLIHQFLQTASASTSKNEEMEITATIDARVKTITEASIRRHIKLEDSDGISTLPNTKIFKQLDLMGISKGYNGVDIPLFPTMLVRVTPTKVSAQWEAHTQQDQPEDHLRVFSAAKVLADAAKNVHTYTRRRKAVSTGSGGVSTASRLFSTVEESVSIVGASMPVSTAVNTLGSDEGSMSLQELTVLCTKLFSKVENLEADLKQTKQVYGVAYTKLIIKVKKLEKTIKTSQARRRTKIVVSDDEEDLEDSSKQERMIEEIDQDAEITLLEMFKLLLSTGSGEVSTASRLVSTAEELVSTAGASMQVSTAGMIQKVNKDKGKGIMTESESEQTKTKLQQRQERAGYEAAEDIQDTIEVDEELAQRIQAEEREKYSEAKKARLLVELVNQRKKFFAQQRAEAKRNKLMTPAQQNDYMSNYIKN
ncbi:hypothetical protein Tco_0117884, partial [Tanacetum coccineum]